MEKPAVARNEQIEQILNRNDKLACIELLALDVDGVMTDGSIIIGQEDELSKHFNAHDGLGLSLAMRHGIQVALITGRHSEIVLHRAMELGISNVYENVTQKGRVLGQIAESLHIPMGHVAFMGDDLNDLPAFQRAAVSFAPQDAVPEVKERAYYVTEKNGGCGAVREVCEKILKAKGVWNEIVEGYLQSGYGDKQ
jgi:3-deoxy-D-manno-octulosonate 8-phosphate phosphatase (KDO 8-P phosphatase)